MKQKNWYGVMILAMLVWASATAQVFAHDLYDVQRANQEQNARWIAGDTEISRLSSQDRQLRLGHIPTANTMGMRIMSTPTVQRLATYPSALDWRNNGGNYVTSIKDQKSCGSCWAFASTAALESAYLIAHQQSAGSEDDSEQIMLSCSGAGSCNGGTINAAAEWLRSTGDAPDSYYPYTATNGSCASALSGWQSQTQKITSWAWATTSPATVDLLKQGLNTYGPLVTTMAVYQDFFYYVSGVYHYTSGVLEGYHAVELIGYNDAGQYFIVKNSWGASWGEQGFFRIAYSELTSPVAFGAYSIGYSMSVQPQPTSCTYTVSSTGANVPLSGGTGTINVTVTGSNCKWNASSSVPWIVVTAGASGTTSGVVSYSVSANTPGANMGAPARSGTLSVAGYTYTVNQANLNCIYTTALETSGAGALFSQIDVYTSDPACTWTATPQQNWITLQSGSSGTGNGVIKYSIQPNQSVTARMGQIYAAGQPITFVEDAGLSCSYTPTPLSISVSKGAGSYAISLSSPTGCSWTAKSGASWLALPNTSGNGSGALTLVYQANTTGVTRTGTVTIGNSTVTLTQLGK